MRDACGEFSEGSHLFRLHQLGLSLFQVHQRFFYFIVRRFQLVKIFIAGISRRKPPLLIPTGGSFQSVKPERFHTTYIQHTLTNGINWSVNDTGGSSPPSVSSD